MANYRLHKIANPTDEFIRIKHRGKIYTPDYLVEIILDCGHYISGNINKKHIIDNSCGDGQFMIHIIDRYCKDFLSISSDIYQLKNELEEYIHAIEIEKKELDICIDRCNNVASIYGITNVNWNFVSTDALKTSEFDGQMDFVVGNPPYVRVHNLNEDFDSVKEYMFGNGGMTDLYIVFYEIGIKMLNKTGILAYITPSSFFTSVAGTNMRLYLNRTNILESICDLKHFQPFNAITYTAIVILNKSKKDKNTDYYEFDSENLRPYLVDRLTVDDYLINNNYYFSTKKNIQILKDILFSINESDIEVKNGFATLADDVYINDFAFESKYIIPVVKASRAKWTRIFYPYDRNSKLVSETELRQDRQAFEYILSKKNRLLNRNNERDAKKFWYAFGRSQAINDTYKDKISINALIRDSSDLKIIDVPAGSGIYSGLYILSKTVKNEDIKNALTDKEFGVYISLLGKYKSGGYYTFSSKDVKFYLDYKLGYRGIFDNAVK